MYQKRWIKHRANIQVDDWHIKSYSISLYDDFKSQAIFTNITPILKNWLGDLNSFNQNHENMAFLIVHEATEGVFTLLNTWVGNNMVQTHVYLSEYNNLGAFKKISGDGLFACVWELEVINHERLAWIEHILKRESKPEYQDYLNDVLNTYF